MKRICDVNMLLCFGLVDSTSLLNNMLSFELKVSRLGLRHSNGTMTTCFCLLDLRKHSNGLLRYAIAFQERMTIPDDKMEYYKDWRM